MTGKKPSAAVSSELNVQCSDIPPKPLQKDASIIRYFLEQEPSITKELTQKQVDFLNAHYPGLNLSI
jgi:ABC-type lipopolysaccharide export system ATPase subunit